MQSMQTQFLNFQKTKTEQVQKKWELCGKYVDFVHERIKIIKFISLQFDEISRMP